jgi:hypothetical protein
MRRVSIGNGETPVKTSFFNTQSPPANVQIASPQRVGMACDGIFKNTPKRSEAETRRRENYALDDAKKTTERPTTSRSVPNPSPEK